MQYQNIKILTIALLVFVLSSCVHNYKYISRGSFEYEPNVRNTAVIYWRMDEGRLYYGPSYEAKDSGISLRICKRTTKEFVPDQKNNSENLILLGKSGDLLVSEVDTTGKISFLNPAILVNPQNKVACGRLITEDKDGNSLLKEGSNPIIIFMCNNSNKPNRFPKAKQYTFGDVEKSEYKESDSAPKACID